MRYWVYINDKVTGPFDPDTLVTLDGFTPNTLICDEQVAARGGQEWVKASSVFEFDEVPAAATSAQESPAPQQQEVAAVATADTNILLEKLNAITQEMSNLQAKLDSMQTHLDQALEQNKKLSSQAATQTFTSTSNNYIPAEAPLTDTPATQTPAQNISSTHHAEPNEEEIIIQAAMNSMYGGKLAEEEVKEEEEEKKEEEKKEEEVKETAEEETQEIEDEGFHDLVTGETLADFEREKEEEEIHNIETQLNFTPITDPSADDSKKSIDLGAQETEENKTEEKKEEPAPEPEQKLELDLDAEPKPEPTPAQETPTQSAENDTIDLDLELIPVEEESTDASQKQEQPVEDTKQEENTPAEEQPAQETPVEEPKQEEEAAAQEQPEPETPAEINDEDVPQEEQPAPQPETEEEPKQETAEQAAVTAKVVKEALITTPSADEAAKDALINELTNSAKEDILDQIIAEHQEEEQTSVENKESHAGEIALGAATAGLAAASLVSLVDKDTQAEPAPEVEPEPEVELAPEVEPEAEATPMAIATDKENPEKLEEVLPAEQMPEDVSNDPMPENVETQPLEQVQEGVEPELASVEETASVDPVVPEQEQTPTLDMTPVEEGELPTAQEEAQPEQAELQPVENDLPTLPTENEQTEMPAEQEHPETEDAQMPQAPEMNGALPEEETPNTEDAQIPQAPEMNEALPEGEEAPASSVESLSDSQEEQPVEKEETPTTPSTPMDSEEVGGITQKDLQDAFGLDENAFSAVPAVPHGNPNDLTEIELKEGSTYLISDFVPPAQVGDDLAQAMHMKASDDETNVRPDAFQDMLETSATGQDAQPLNADGLPADFAATQVHLENTIQAKRGASLDIKTVPMVPEPAETTRLPVSDLNDVNAQHDVRVSSGLSKSTKFVIGTLVGLLLMAVAYVGLGLTHLLPESVNLFASKGAKAKPSQELLTEPQQPTEEELEAMRQAEIAANAIKQATEKVQNFPLPNGYRLKGFIESKHPNTASENITWDVTQAVEPENYSISVKVPPDNPQSFVTTYRFNYSMTTGLLEPTISSAKNLLDEAYKKPEPQKAAASTGKKRTATSRKGGTGRKKAGTAKRRS